LLTAKGEKMTEEPKNSTGSIIGTLNLTDLRNICVNSSDPILRDNAFKWAMLLKEFIDSHKFNTDDSGKDICVVLSLP